MGRAGPSFSPDQFRLLCRCRRSATSYQVVSLFDSPWLPYCHIGRAARILDATKWTRGRLQRANMFVRPPDDPAGRRGIPHGKRSADKLWTSRPVRSCVVIYRFVRCGQSRLSQSLAVEDLHLLSAHISLLPCRLRGCVWGREKIHKRKMRDHWRKRRCKIHSFDYALNSQHFQFEQR